MLAASFHRQCREGEESWAGCGAGPLAGKRQCGPCSLQGCRLRKEQRGVATRLEGRNWSGEASRGEEEGGRGAISDEGLAPARVATGKVLVRAQKDFSSEEGSGGERASRVLRRRG
ncbi:hypothetical protein NDU88_004744 [Pleurodeles waltl]|uniref:Uncharacterized protein n=1 Tax=Pleurodeles waltl TaxID=8319 RepID=A0AAV7TSV0_PLEWA|nr:hypothetical protein NDU88_004744 [Pleurodeles waltl]